MTALRTRLLALALLLSLPACGDDPVSPAADPTAPIDEIIGNARLLTTLTTALQATGLDDELSGAGPYTLFAPTDEAFFNLGVESTDAYLDPENRDVLTAVLRRHIALGAFSLDDLTDGAELPTLDGGALIVRVVGSRVSVGDGVNQATLSGLSSPASNGFVHEIDTLLRGVLTTRDRLRLIPLADTFREGLDQTGTLDEIAGPHTILIALDDGFDRLAGGAAPLLLGSNADILDKVITYHVVSPDEVLPLEALLDAGPIPSEAGPPLAFSVEDDLAFVNGESLIVRDVRTADGMLHFVLRPILEPLTLWEHLRITPQASRLRQAFTRASLQPLLDDGDAGPFTLFVPDDDAFEDLGDGVRIPLLNGQQPVVLGQVTRFHIAEGRFPFSDLGQGDLLPTLEGASLRIGRDNATSELVVARALFEDDLDVRAANGVMHYVSEVLNPPLNLVDQTFFGGYLRFLDLIELAGLEEELRAEGPLTFVAPASVPSPLFTDRFSCYRQDAVYNQIAEGVFPLTSGLGNFIPTIFGDGIVIAPDGTVQVASPGGLVLDREIDADNGLFYGVQTSAYALPEEPDCP